MKPFYPWTLQYINAAIVVPLKGLVKVQCGALMI
jgi:hypothetical protein